MKNALFNHVKEDYLSAYKWYADSIGKSGVKVWKAKDNKAVGLLIKYLRDLYLKEHAKKLNSDEMRQVCRIWLNKAFTTAPEWLKNSGELTLLVSRFDEINNCLDPKSPAGIISKIQKDKRSSLKYNPKIHELQPENRQGEASSLEEILLNIANKKITE